MKKLIFTLFIFILNTSITYSANRYWIANSASNWNNSANWSTSSGGAGGASVPVAGDFVYFNANGTGTCTLDINAAFDGINTSNFTGIIDFNGFTFNPAVSGTVNCVFAKGTFNDGTSTQSLTINTTGVVRFSGASFNIPLNITAGALRFDGGTFNNPVDVVSTGSSNYSGLGGCTFNSTFKATTTGTNYFLMGYTNPDIFNGDVTLINNGTSRIRIAFNSAGNQFNGNIIVGSTSGTGVYIGEGASASSTLAATKTVTIDTGGFSAGDLEFRNFTQTGNTAQVLTCTGTARIYNYDSNWGGDVTFIAPRMYTRGTTYNRTAYLEKNGASNDNSVGGNTFVMNSELKNSGSGYFLMGNGNPDIFQGNLILNNTGNYNLYLAHNSTGNQIQGNLTVTESSTGTNAATSICNSAIATLTIDGITTITNNSSATTSRVTFAATGKITLNNNLSITNNSTSNSGTIIVAGDSAAAITVTGNTTISNNGGNTTQRIYLGNGGDGTFNGTLTISNMSSATNSQVFCNYSSTSTGQYNGNIQVENTNVSSDGVLFGDNGGNSTLAANKTITIGAGGFVAGDLEFRNFTQTGNTAQSLTCSGTAKIYNYDSNWGGDVTFISPRLVTRGTTYNRTSYLEKTGANNDGSAGGNTFVMNTELRNSGSGYFLMGNGNPDIFQANLVMNNTGTHYLYLAYNSLGNTIAGTLTATNTGSGTNSGLYFCNYAASNLTVNGVTQINNYATGTSNVFFPHNGNITLNNNISIDNNSTGNSANIYLSNGSSSSLMVNGSTTLLNAGAGTTKRIYLGRNGDITLNGTLNISNSSSANNSQVLCSFSNTSSAQYNDNIVLENTDANGDGVSFGSSGGTATLAATKTVTIGAGGFIAGVVLFRNFTQVGNTTQSLTCTGTAEINNYDSNWGGDVTFIAPRMQTRGTTYNRTSYLEKTGALNDGSAGGNTFILNAELKNSGSGYFLMGYNDPDDFQANLVMNNTGTNYLYLGYNSIGNTIAGTLTAINSGTGNNTGINFNNGLTSTLTINGATVIQNTPSSTSSTFSFPSNGTITLNNTLDITNNSTGTNGRTTIANGSTSSIIISGNTSVINNGGNSQNQIIFGNQGDITVDGTLTIENHSSANNSHIYFNHSPNSTGLYNENITVENTDANGDGVLFGNNGGNGTLAANKTITISAGGFVAGYLYFRNFTQVGNTTQSLTCSGTGFIYNYNSNWGGDVTLIAPRMITRGTTYNRTSYLEKTGASNDYSSGGNTFVMNTELRNSGSGYFLMGNGNPDDFQANLILNNTSSSRIYLAHNSAGNTVSGTLTANNTCTGVNAGIYISTAVASSITIGGATILNNLGNASSNSFIYFGNSGDVTLNNDLQIINSPVGSTGYVYIATNTDSYVEINGNTTALNSTPGTNERVYLGYNGDITFNGNLDISNQCSASNSHIYCNFASNSTGLYNGNVTVESTNTVSDGVLFGYNGGIGTLANGKTITIGGGGFVAGYLYFRNFTQVGNTPQTLQPTGTTRFQNFNSVWNGNVDFRSPSHYTRTTTYNGTAYLEKNGTGNNASYGGNTFNGDAIFKVTSTGYFMPANGVANDFNANATYIKTNSGPIYPGYNCSNTYAGDITVDANSTVRFGAATNGRTIFDGTIAQNINIVGATPRPEFRDVETQNPNSEITLNTPITVLTELDLQQGNLISTTTNLIYTNDNSIVSNVSDNAFVDGPLEKIGNDAYTFPVGKSGVYRPLAISAPSSGSARFRGEFFASDVVTNGIPDLPVEPTIHHVSDCEYWILDRIATTNAVNVTLSYKNYSANNCSGVVSQPDLKVARWDGGIWRDHGNGGTTGTAANGTVVTSAPVTSFSPFTLATLTDINPLPIELLEFTATNNKNVVDLHWQTASEQNNDYFTVERSADGQNFEPILKQNGAGNSSEILNYYDTDKNPLNGTSYYRLKQTDFDGKTSYSGIVSVTRKDDAVINVYPNPVNDMVNISVNKSNYTVRVYGLDGRLILTDVNPKQIDMSQMASGIYQFVIEANGQIIETIKVVKQ